MTDTGKLPQISNSKPLDVLLGVANCSSKNMSHKIFFKFHRSRFFSQCRLRVLISLVIKAKKILGSQKIYLSLAILQSLGFTIFATPFLQ